MSSAGYSSISAARSANESLGHSWFSAESIDFYGSRVETEIIGGFYFVESRFKIAGDEDSPRVYAPVAVAPNGNISYLDSSADHEHYESLEAARARIDAVVGQR